MSEFGIQNLGRTGDGHAGVLAMLLLPDSTPASDPAPCLKTVLNKGGWEKECKGLEIPQPYLQGQWRGTEGKQKLEPGWRQHPVGGSRRTRIQPRLISH